MKTLRRSGPATGRFVLEKLSGSELQYDLLLEARGAMVGWAVAGGLSSHPGVRRTAVRIEDTPEDMDEVAFDEEVPEEEILVWDRGRYTSLERPEGKRLPLDEALERGQLWLRLEGEKSRGLYEVVRVPGEEFADDEEWVVVLCDEEEG